MNFTHDFEEVLDFRVALVEPRPSVQGRHVGVNTILIVRLASAVVCTAHCVYFPHLFAACLRPSGGNSKEDCRWVFVCVNAVASHFSRFSSNCGLLPRNRCVFTFVESVWARSSRATGGCSKGCLKGRVRHNADRDRRTVVARFLARLYEETSAEATGAANACAPATRNLLLNIEMFFGGDVKGVHAGW